MQAAGQEETMELRNAGPAYSVSSKNKGQHLINFQIFFFGENSDIWIPF